MCPVREGNYTYKKSLVPTDKCVCLVLGSAGIAQQRTLYQCPATLARHHRGIKHHKASLCYADSSNGAHVQAPYNADFNCLQLHHVLYQTMINIHNWHFSHPYVYLLNFPVLAVLLLMARGAVAVAGFAETRRVLLLVALTYDSSALAEPERRLIRAQGRKRTQELPARICLLLCI